MATTGDPLWPSASTWPNTNVYPGQGLGPYLWALISYGDIASQYRDWNDVSKDVRDFSTSRGRDNELTEFTSGSATLTLGNRTRQYDPTLHTYIHPMNQIWLREQFSGLTNEVYSGYITSYDQQWPGGGFSDAVCVVNAVDEFKLLAQDALGVTNPPLDSYAAVVLYDNPVCYWPMDDSPYTLQQTATVGKNLSASTVLAGLTTGAIVGETATTTGWQAASRISSVELSDGVTLAGEPTDPGGIGGSGVSGWGFALEMWLRFPNVKPAFAQDIAIGPQTTGPQDTFKLTLNTTSDLNFFVRQGGGFTSTITSGTIAANTWYHVVCYWAQGNQSIYINGALSATTPFNGVFAHPLITGTHFAIGGLAYNADFDFDEVALYKYELRPDRIAAHYTAGALRGFPQQPSGNRVGAVLDSVGSHAPRLVQAGDRSVIPVSMKAQDPLSEIHSARSGEATDAVFFTGADGTLTFLSASHRNVAPWNVVQATFGDEGTGVELSYSDLDVDYSDSFIANDWNVTRVGGLVQNANDGPSIARYGKRTQSLTLPVVSDSVAAAVSSAMLAKYRDPLLRLLSISFQCGDTPLIDALFQLEIESRVRVIRTLPGGGWVDRQMFVQKIEVAGTAGQLWSVKLGLSEGSFVFQQLTGGMANFDAAKAAYPTFDDMKYSSH